MHDYMVTSLRLREHDKQVLVGEDDLACTRIDRYVLTFIAFEIGANRLHSAIVARSSTLGPTQTAAPRSRTCHSPTTASTGCFAVRCSITTTGRFHHTQLTEPAYDIFFSRQPIHLTHEASTLGSFKLATINAARRR